MENEMDATVLIEFSAQMRAHAHALAIIQPIPKVDLFQLNRQIGPIMMAMPCDADVVSIILSSIYLQNPNKYMRS